MDEDIAIRQVLQLRLSSIIRNFVSALRWRLILLHKSAVLSIRHCPYHIFLSHSKAFSCCPRPCLVALVPFCCPIQMTIKFSKWRKGYFHSRNGRRREWDYRNQTGPGISQIMCRRRQVNGLGFSASGGTLCHTCTLRFDRQPTNTQEPIYNKSTNPSEAIR